MVSLIVKKHCNLLPFQKVLGSRGNYVLLQTQDFLDGFDFVIMVENTLRFPLEFFVFTFFASTVRSEKTWRTSF